MPGRLLLSPAIEDLGLEKVLIAGTRRDRKGDPGDVLIQRGTNHAWSNRTDKACRIAFVLIDAEALPA